MVKLGETEMQVRFRLDCQSFMFNATSESLFLNVQRFFPASWKLQALVMRCVLACHQQYLSCYYESWVVPAGVPSALADIGGGVEANY